MGKKKKTTKTGSYGPIDRLGQFQPLSTSSPLNIFAGTIHCPKDPGGDFGKKASGPATKLGGKVSSGVAGRNSSHDGHPKGGEARKVRGGGTYNPWNSGEHFSANTFRLQ